MRNSSESNKHADLIAMMVRHFIGQGAKNVGADLPGCAGPDLIYGTKQSHAPDLTAENRGRIPRRGS